MTVAIRVLIADDHAVVREGLRGLITSERGMEVISEARDGHEAVLQARALHPDVILIDLVMPHLDGLEAIRQIKTENPEARILVLTSFADDDKVFPAIKSGARKLIREISAPSNLPLAAEPLTEREVDVLRLLAQGLSNEEIAESLFIAQRTVSTHVSNILGKLHLANRTQAALYALREGLARLDADA
jgi:two-component system, NarL family, response regulator LiaR